MRAYSLAGTLIEGTLESVPGTAQIDPDSFTRNEDGSLDFEYGGYTEIWWDDQETIYDKNGQALFVDEHGDTWPANEVILVPHKEDE